MKPPKQYQQFYCEENAWFVADAALERGLEAWVILVTNQARSVAMFSQRAGRERGEPTIWDYHVFVCGRDAKERLVHWDLDSIVPFGASLERWWRATFPNLDALSEAYQPCFRAITGREYVDRFSSDRSHMRDKRGAWRAPPPDWEPIVEQGAANYPHALLESGSFGREPWFDHASFVERIEGGRGFDDISGAQESGHCE